MKKSIVKTVITLVLLLCVSLGFQPSANANVLTNMRDKVTNTVNETINKTTVIHASISFRNESNSKILVVMDRDRESYNILPNSSVTFMNANLGDAPTFNVYDSNRNALYGRKINPISLNNSLGWNGKDF